MKLKKNTKIQVTGNSPKHIVGETVIATKKRQEVFSNGNKILRLQNLIR